MLRVQTATENVFSLRVQNCNCVCPCADSSRECTYKTWHWKFISRYPNVCASKEQKSLQHLLWKFRSQFATSSGSNQRNFLQLTNPFWISLLCVELLQSFTWKLSNFRLSRNVVSGCHTWGYCYSICQFWNVSRVFVEEPRFLAGSLPRVAMEIPHRKEYRHEFPRPVVSSERARVSPRIGAANSGHPWRTLVEVHWVKPGTCFSCKIQCWPNEERRDHLVSQTARDCR